LAKLPIRTNTLASSRACCTPKEKDLIVFERFTERARQVVVLAQEEARILKHNYIGTEHILLGLLRARTGRSHRG
jgi:hypothetical protein